MTFAVTTGAGLIHAKGSYVRVDPPPVASLAALLSSLPPAEEAWWSGHLWKENVRRATNWVATSAIVADIDYEADHMPFPEHVAELAELATSGRLPGTLFHLTPHGARVVFVLDRPCSEKKHVLGAAEGVGKLLSDVIEGTGYKVDPAPLKDLARLFFTPNAKAKGAQRRADVVTMRDKQYTVAELIAESVPVTKPAAPVRKMSAEQSATFDEAAERWNRDHSRKYPRYGAPCPVCKDKASFGHIPEHEDRWYCFSTDHPHGVGQPGDKGYHGDALDLEAYDRGCKPVAVLVKDGYLAPHPPRRAYTGTASSTGGPAAEPSAPPEPNEPFRAWRSRSYLTAVDLISKNERDILEGRPLELNEMTGRPELGRKPVKDSDLHRVRALIESRFAGGVDKNNNETGLQLSVADVFAAADQVAHSRPYHPVRAYLESLKWDGTERLNAVAEDILGAQRTALNQAMIRRWFISAVARPMSPGCKVDTVLILVGKQGAMKSTFFRVLAGEWFLDTPLDIGDKDAFQQLRSAWIAEWAELESLARARDATAVKAFLTSPRDTYRPSYGRHAIDVPRTSVIAGTTNHDEFLSDETGARRFWPIRVGAIDLELARRQRDQLWAEAMHFYTAGEQWWFTEGEERQLSGVHDEHRVRDAWEDLVLPWAESQLNPFMTSEVLEKPLSKPRGQWGKSDEMRVSRVLKSGGYERRTQGKGSKKWFKTRSTTGQPTSDEPKC